jgi:hypothetical protein
VRGSTVYVPRLEYIPVKNPDSRVYYNSGQFANFEMNVSDWVDYICVRKI